MGNNMPPSGSGPNIDPAWLGQLVENQKNELAIRAQELEIQKQQDANNLVYAKEALAAQERDRGHDRECTRQSRRDIYRLILGLVSLIVALLCVAIYLGKDDVAQEIIRAIVYISAGGVGGYGVAKSRSRWQGSEVSPSSKDA